jgi:hypothetical protein
MSIKKAWLTPWNKDGSLVSLTLESSGATSESGKLNFREQEFPDRSTKEPRHTVAISLLSDEDVVALHATLESHLAERGLLPPFDGGGWERDGHTIKRGDRDSITVDIANGESGTRAKSCRAIQLLVLLNGQ